MKRDHLILSLILASTLMSACSSKKPETNSQFAQVQVPEGPLNLVGCTFDDSGETLACNDPKNEEDSETYDCQIKALRNYEAEVDRALKTPHLDPVVMAKLAHKSFLA
ncbi:MAG: hypothetical protein KDD22_02140 [Bdellovibrionales bacterium]|nr:hypothetical protein [Bdellovibrionales bacterium]